MVGIADPPLGLVLSLNQVWTIGELGVGLDKGPSPLIQTMLTYSLCTHTKGVRL